MPYFAGQTKTCKYDIFKRRVLFWTKWQADYDWFYIRYKVEGVYLILHKLKQLFIFATSR